MSSRSALLGMSFDISLSPHISHEVREGWFSKVHRGQAKPNLFCLGRADVGRSVGDGTTAPLKSGNVGKANDLSRIEGRGRIPHVRHGGTDAAGVTCGT